MNIFGVCFIIASLFAPSFSKTVAIPAVQEVNENPVKNVLTTDTIILKNQTSKTEDGNVFENIETFVKDFLGPSNELQESGSDEGRTFGHKRLQFMLMPMMYKMGVMMTMLMVLTVISLKGLAIGVILLVLKLSAFFGKFYASSHYQPPVQGWSASQPQPVHVHVHNSPGAHHGHHPYSGWESASGPTEDEHYYYKG